MAGVRRKGDSYYCTFRFRGRRFYFTIGKVPQAQALAKGAEVDETLGLVERGRLAVPDGVTLEDFVAAGGKAPVVAARPETVSARQLFDRYLTTHANGTIEELRSKAAVDLAKGDMVEMFVGGGAGFGRIEERPDTLIERDLADGILTRDPRSARKLAAE